MCCGDLGCAPVGSDCCPSWFCYPGYTCCDDYCCPTESSATTAPASAETEQPYSNVGGCNLNGDTISGTVNCNGNKNTQNSAGTLRVNHILLVCCIATVALFLLVNGDNNTGGCSFSGGNVSDVNCNGNTNNVNEPKPNVASSLSAMDMRWLMILCIILNLGLFVGADSAGGCVINGGDVQNLNCSGNTQNNINGNVTIQPSTAPSNEYSNGLSPGAIVGIALAAVSVAIALLAFGAAIVNKDAVVGPDRQPVRHFKRVALYRIVEGCTLLFGCGTLGGLERAMGRFVQRGGKWHAWEEDVPPYPGVMEAHNKT